MTENNKIGNPAVVGLAGFGMTTLLLQLHNLGICSIGPILWLGLAFGGAAQFIAGLQEFKTGNNFGFCAFTSYGAFWIATVLLLTFKQYGGVFTVTASDMGYFLAAWGIFTSLLFLESIRHHTVIALIFLTLALGFFGLATADFMEAAGHTLAHSIKQIAAIDLII
ncbi:MAG: acetate uptake transporter, partial [Lentisphaeria bacterium]